MQNRICVIGNIGPHYRFPIYNLMNTEFKCDFYFGDRLLVQIKQFPYNDLTGFKRTLKNRFCGKLYWMAGSVRLAFKKYNIYILGGEPYCISSWFILILCIIMKKRTIAWTHGWYGRENKIKSIIKKFYFGLFSDLLVYGEHAIRLMKEQGFSPEKMHCIANSLDSDKDLKLRSELKSTSVYKNHFGNSCSTVIYCGRIQKWKKLEMLIDAISLLKAEGKNVNVIFVGKDVEDVRIGDYARSNGLSDQVWMYGPCYDDLILGELFYNAAVCVSPGNVGLTAIHSLSFGCPVITHDDFRYQNPEFEAIIPGKTGDFFKYGSVADMARIIWKWCSIGPSDREIIKQESYREIDRKWNIHYQINVIKQVVCE